MTTATINGTTLTYDVVGDGEPLILIHGSWGERTTWGFILPGLGEAFRVVSYDRRGHGESTGPPAEGTVHDDVADAAALIEAVHGGPAYVVANSYGAIIALRLAAERPDLVKRMTIHEPPMLLILEGTEHQGVLDAKAAQIEEVRRLLEAGDHRAAAIYFVENVALGEGAWDLIPPPLQEMFVNNAETFLGEVRDPDALRIDRAALKGIECEVLLTYGDESPSWFLPISEEIESCAPTVRRQLFPGAGHVPHLTHSEDFVALVKDELLG